MAQIIPINSSYHFALLPAGKQREAQLKSILKTLRERK